ncbi:hypothetical protein Pla110_18580 [Polystyrenella longa]|uniref:Uncharacterized protein n=1 Tax=Polystyrenella longa TaxID=2528007 RepID=A0A518CLM4_9PLAN|nr:hypothetical protein [Polystyrenella longa]QDU80135.1 hypothetical protein Pla110_18580 [Polystyrenella longa]
MPLHDNKAITITLRPLIRYLGLLLGIVGAAPSVFGLLYAMTHPSAILEDPWAIAFPLILGPLFTFMVYRWMFIGGQLTTEEVVLRGWFRTIRMPTADLAHVRQGSRRVDNNSGTSTRVYYELIDHNGKSLGEVPAMLLAGNGWKHFLERMHQVAAISRRVYESNVKLQLQDKPVDEWTIDDIERYEDNDH